MANPVTFSLSASDLTALGSDIVDQYLPFRNPTYSSHCTTAEKYYALVTVFYSTLEMRQAGAGQVGAGNYIRTTFLSGDDAILDAVRNVGHASLQTISKHPLSLFKILCTLANTEIPNTRGHLDKFRSIMTNADINALMHRLTARDDDPQDEDDFLLAQAFKRTVRLFRRTLQYSIHRTRILCEVLALIQKLTDETEEAKALYSDLQVSLVSRNDCYAKVQSAARLKKDLIAIIRQLMDHWQAEHESNQKAIFEVVLTMNQFSLTQITATLNNSTNAGSLYNYSIRLANPRVNPETLNDIKTLTDRLNPLIENIKSYSESVFDAALSKRNNLKVLIGESMRKANDFVDNEDSRNVAGLKQCKSELEILKNEIMTLRIAGVSCTSSPDELDGYDQGDLETSINLLSGFIVELEDAAKRKKERQKLEETELVKSAPTISIKPLRSQADWLIFLRSVNEILPKHHSDLVKLELLKKSLHAKDDIQLTKNLSNYKQVMIYLKTKYSSESAVPRLIQSLLEMKACKDNESQSYKNLTTFNAILQQLETHKAESKLDSHLRTRLLPLLLSHSSLHDFTRKKILTEIEWRKEAQLEDNEDNDDDLLSVHLDNPTEEAELEAKKLKFFLDAMKTYLQVARSLTTQLSITGAGTATGEKSGNKNKSTSHSARQGSAATNACIYCHQEHQNRDGQPRLSLSYCQKFGQLSVQDKIKFCSKHQVCKRCLIPKSLDPENHSDGGCLRAEKGNYFCKRCGQDDPKAFNHHSSLHIDRDAGSSTGGRGGGQSARGASRGGRGRGRGRGGTSRGASSSAARHTQNESVTTDTKSENSSPQSTSVENSQESFHSQLQSHGTSVATYNTKPRVPQPGDNGILNLNQNRIFLSSVTTASVSAGVGRGVYPLLALLDSGSGQGWISARAVATLGLVKNPNQWTGQISTTMGTKQSSLETYNILIYDKYNVPHNVTLFKTEYIGHRPRLPPQLQTDIINQLGAQPGLVSNVCGEISIILGLDSIHLLAHIDYSVHNSPTDPLFAGVRLFKSELSPLSFPSGAVGKSLSEYQQSKTITFFAEQDNVQSFMSMTGPCSFHNHITPDSANLLSSLPPRKTNPVILESLYSTGELCNKCPARYSGQSGQENERIPLAVPGAENERNPLAVPGAALSWTTGQVRGGELLTTSRALATSYSNQKNADETILETMQVVSPNVICKDCNAKIKACKTCRYLSSEVSLQDRINLEKIRRSISVSPDPQDADKFVISARFLLKAPPHLLFNASNSQYELVRRNAIRLRQRLIKRGLWTNWQTEWSKTLGRKEWAEHKSYRRDQPIQNFISLNFALKESSSSQPLRIISNSALTNKSNKSLNGALITAPSNLNSGRLIMLRWRLYSTGLISDLSRFYRSCKTGELEANLRLTVWFDPSVTAEEEDPQTRVFACQVLNYGDSISSSVSEIVSRNVIGPKLKMKESRELVISLRYCDDMMSSLTSKTLGEKVAADLKTTFSTYNYCVKHVFLTDSSIQSDDETRHQNVMGISWDRKLDTFRSAQSFHSSGKERGAYTTDKLCFSQIKNLIINRQLLARYLGQLFSYTQVESCPMLVMLKIYFARATRTMPVSDWKTPINAVDEDLDKEIRSVLLPCLARYHDNVAPFPRCLFKETSSQLEKIVVSVDSGAECLGILIHFVINTNGKRESNLVLASSKTHHLTVPDGELQSVVYGIRQAAEIISDLLDQLKLQKSFDLIIASDSLISLSQLNPSRVFKKVTTRNSSFAVHKTLENLPHLGISDLKIKVVHIPGDQNPADKVSKLFPDPLQQVNSQVYRHGASCYTDPDWPSDRDLIIYCDKSGSRYNIPTTERNDGADEAEDQTSGDISTFHSNQCRELTQKSLKILSWPPEIRDKVKNSGYFNLETLQRLIFSSRTLQKLLGTVIVILRATTKLLSGVTNTDHQKKIAWTVILKSSQKHFPPTLTRLKHWYPAEDSSDGVIRGQTRGDNVSTEERKSILLTSPPCISSRHKSLIKLLVMFHHKKLVGGRVYHCDPLTTAGTSRSSPDYSFISAGQLRATRSIVSECTTCRRIHSKPSTDVAQSPVRSEELLVTHKYPLFRIMSIDTIGPYYLLDGRRRKSYYLLVSVCIISSSLSLQYLDNIKMENIVFALQTHCLRHGKPSILYMDAGTSLHLEKHDRYTEIFGDMRIFRVEPRHQFLNFSERKISFLRRIWRTTNQNRFIKHPSEHLSFQQLHELIVFSEFIANSKPISGNEIGLSPNHLLLPQYLFETSTKGHSFRILENNFSNIISSAFRATKLHHSILVSHMKFLLMAENRTTQAGHKYKEKFIKDDIVLFVRDDQVRLARVEKVFKSHCDIYLRSPSGGGYRTMSCHQRFLTILYRPVQSRSVHQQAN